VPSGGLLLLPRGDELRIAAEATTSGDTVIVRLTEQSMAAAALPESIVHYVIRTQGSVLLDDAAAPNAFATECLPRRAARPVHPLRAVAQPGQAHRGALSRKHPDPHVFTATRSAVLTLLASQGRHLPGECRLYAERQRAEEASGARPRRSWPTWRG